MEHTNAKRVYESYSDVIGDEYHVYKGIPFPGHHVPAERLERVPNFEVRADDILVCGYMKSGNHWLKEIASLIVHGHDSDRVKENIFMRAPFLEVSPKVMGDSLTNLTNLPRNGPRIMGTHLRASLLPHGVTKERKGKVIFLIRNPKDIAVSMYHFHRMNRNLGLYEGTWAQFFQWFLNGEVVFGSWFDYVLDWIQFLQQNRYFVREI
ncbi:sulfotransferase 1A2 [Lingula anatina]|uniref:Sulfotransferase 1A2 n=1 Tax=Lingula anatina TaxID=7574 RepID=A0A1S3JGX0_LINAN|nr:sulfotransferase 1A2 [Lingula anatina]|eukprot:XP_013409655.1 sulfotransferase 1A2 [Lingula anatina]